jgi:hypothetical protein
MRSKAYRYIEICNRIITILGVYCDVHTFVIYYCRFAEREKEREREREREREW